MSDGETTTKRWKACHIDRKLWSIHEEWRDEQGRRCTRVIAEVHEQAADPEAAATNAKLIVEAVNRWNAG